MCYEIEHARDIVSKANEKGLFVQVGHQRRYNPNYNLAMKRFREEDWLGRINHMEMQWHRNNAGRRVVNTDYVYNEMEAKFITTDIEHHLNWRIYDELSGGLCTDSSPTPLTWRTGLPAPCPKKVYASGGIDYWRDGRTCADNISVIHDLRSGPQQRQLRQHRRPQ